MERPDPEFVSNESAQATTRVIAVIVFGVGLAIAYWIWPVGITGTQLAHVTFGDLLQAILSGVITLAAFVMAAMLWF